MRTRIESSMHGCLCVCQILGGTCSTFVYFTEEITNRMKENLAKLIEQSAHSFEITRDIINACMEAKGKDISVLDVSKSFGMSDYFIVVSGRSDRQVQGISNRILETLEKSGLTPVSIEGFEEGQWVLIDCGDVVAHIFYEPLRSHYDLESLWFKAPRLDLKKHFKMGPNSLAAA